MKPDSILSWIIAICAVFFVSSVTYNIIQQNRDPYDLISMTIITPVKSGKPITISYHFNKNRFCRTFINQFVFRVADNTRVFTAPETLGGATDLGEQRNKSEFVLPKLPAGKYYFRQHVYTECPEGTHGQKFPDAYFEIVD